MVKKRESVGKSINGDVPKESEKIAVRRAVRLAAKIKKARKGLTLKSSWWSEGSIRLFGLILILILNLYLVLPFFGTEAFITSYSGPVIPFLAKIIGYSGLPLSYAIEIVNISFFLMLPVTFYLFVKRVSGKVLVAMLAGLLVSLPISPFAGARIRAVFFSVEGPHMASLALVPLAAYGLLSFLHDGGLKSLLVAGAGSALVGLTSPFGLLTYVIFAGIVTFSEVLLGQGRLKMFRLLMVFLLVGGLSSFWYNPGFFWWMVAGPMGEEARVMLARLLPISFFTLPVLGVFGYLLFDRKSDLQPVFLGSFLSIAFVVIVLAGSGFMPSAPSRYVPELGMALAFLLGILLERLFDYLLNNQKNWSFGGVSHKFWINGLLLILVVFLISVIAGGRERIMAYEPGVLGYWTGVERGEIWLARERFGGGYSLLGYGITIATTAALAVLGVRKRL